MFSVKGRGGDEDGWELMNRYYKHTLGPSIGRAKTLPFAVDLLCAHGCRGLGREGGGEITSATCDLHQEMGANRCRLATCLELF